MSASRGKSHGWRIAGVLTFIVAAGAGWGIWHYGAEGEAAPPARDPGQLRAALAEPDLPDAQRRELGRELRAAQRAEQEQRIREYFAAAESERPALLDRHIDEVTARRQKRPARPAPGEQAQRPEPPEQNGSPARGPFGGQTVAERKARSESQSADERGQHMAYMHALRAQMARRGIELPRGGPGGPGGPGGMGGPGGPRP